jgi:hypothetical protein
VKARKDKKVAETTAAKTKKASDKEAEKTKNAAIKAATKAASKEAARKVKAADHDLQVANRKCKSAKRAIGRTASEFVMEHFNAAIASSSTHEELGDVTRYARVNYVSCLGGGPTT